MRGSPQSLPQRQIGAAALCATLLIAGLLFLVERPALAITGDRGVPSFERQRSFGELNVEVSGVATFDLESAPDDEIVVAFSNGLNRLISTDPSNPSARNSTNFGVNDDRTTSIAAGRVQLPGSTEVISAIISGGDDGRARIYTASRDTAVNIVEVARFTISPGTPIVAVLTGDLDNNGSPDLVFVTRDAAGTNDTQVVVQLGGQNPDNPQSVGQALSVALGNIDSEPNLEILVGLAERMAIYNPTGTSLGTLNPFDSLKGATALATAPIGQSGGTALIAATAGKVRVFALNGTTPTLCSKYAHELEMTERTITRIVAQDLNGDARIDLLLGSEEGQALAFLKGPEAAKCNSDDNRQVLFAEYPVGSQAEGSRYIAVANLDGAGLPDLALASKSRVSALMTASPEPTRDFAGLKLNSPEPIQAFASAQPGASPAHLIFGAGTNLATDTFVPAAQPLFDTLEVGGASGQDLLEILRLDGTINGKPAVAATRRSGGGAQLFTWEGTSYAAVAGPFGPDFDPASGLDRVDALAAANIDGDPTLDLLAMGVNGGLAFYTPAGQLLALPATPAVPLLPDGVGGAVRGLAFGELFERPGSASGLDLAVGRANGSVTLYLGNGTDTITGFLEITTTVSTRTISVTNAGPAVTQLLVADLLATPAGPELYVARSSGNVEAYGFDQATGTVLPVALPVVPGSRLALANLNDAAGQDLVASAANAITALYNRGDMFFSQIITTTAVNSTRLAVSNLNGQGPDEVVANVGGSDPGLFIFAPVPTITLGDPVVPLLQEKVPETFSAVGDLDQDGTMDLVAVGTGGGSLYRNPRGTGVLTGTRLSFTGTARGLALADLDGENGLDIVVAVDAGSGPNQVLALLNKGDGTADAPFEAPFPLYTASGNITKLALGDLNTDGVPDLVVAARSTSFLGLELPARAVVVWLGRTEATTPAERMFAAPESFQLSMSGVTQLALGDLDAPGDGKHDLDLVIASPRSVQIYRNTGNPAARSLSGPTSLTVVSSPSERSLVALALGDADNDGRLDLVTVYDEGPSELRFNSSGGSPFASTPSRTFGLNFVGDPGVRLALGDMNGDQALDIVAQARTSKGSVFFQRESGSYWSDLTGSKPCIDFVPAQARCFSRGSTGTNDLHLADFNGDGALDIVTTRSGGAQANHAIYFNDGSGVAAPARQLFEDSDLADDLATSLITSLATGDLDGDGRPELIGGTFGFLSPPKLIVRPGSGAEPRSYTLPSGLDRTVTAVADFNGDGRDDLALGFTASSYQAVLLSAPDGTFTVPVSPTLGLAAPGVQSMAAGDFNGDNLADLAIAYARGPNLILLNQLRRPGSFVRLDDLSKLTPEVGSRFGASAGGALLSLLATDLDDDGDVDLVTGARDQSSAVYLNNGLGAFASEPNCSQRDAVRCFGTRATVVSLAVADINRDGGLDIVTAEDRGPHVVYLQQPDGSFFDEINLDCFAPDLARVRCFGDESDFSAVVLASDFNGDGHPDIVGRASEESAAIYLNDGSGGLQSTRELSATRIYALAVADVGPGTGDGRPDVVAGVSQDALLFSSDLAAGALPNTMPSLTLRSPCANRSPSPPTTCIFTTASLTLSLSLADLEGDPVRAISVTFSLDGGSSWLPARGRLLGANGTSVFSQTKPPTDTLIRGPLATRCDAAACGYSFEWDLGASGVVGRSDAVVLRAVAYPTGVPAPAGGAPKPFASAQSRPFTVIRERISVVRPFALVPGSYCNPITNPSGSRCVQYLPTLGARPPQLPASLPAAPVLDTRAIVYVVPTDGGRARPPLDSAGQPLRTDFAGNLRGRASIPEGASLFALLPDRSGDKFRVFLSSASIVDGEFGPLPTYQGDRVELRVSRENSLTLLDLVVSVEWDLTARDPYWDTLQQDFDRVSELLYGWTNGQVALGKVTIRDNKLLWPSADIRIYASNAIRPNATVGGIAIGRSAATATSLPGTIRMGATWNRYGERSGTFGEDWPRALAHEIAHYAFSLQDNYLGFDANQRLVALDDDLCPGVMTNPYLNDVEGTGVEFRTQLDWLPGCGDTLLQRTNGASDWSVIERALPWIAPPSKAYKAPPFGPRQLLIDVTEFDLPTEHPGDGELVTPPLLYLSEPVSEGARAVIFRGGASPGLIDLGRPLGRELAIRGARRGDQVCVFDIFPRGSTSTTRPLQGCRTLTTTRGGLPLALGAPPSGWQPELRVTPVNSRTVGITLAVTPTAAMGELQATLFTDSNEVAGPTPLRPTTQPGVFSTTLSLGGGALGGTLYVRGASGYELVADYGLGGSPARSIASAGVENNAPVLSPDGQVIIYGPELTFREQEFYTLQRVTRAPPLPAGRTQVGQAYRLSATEGAPALAQAFISFSYLEREVPPNEEKWLKIYYFDEQKPQLGWQQQQTLLVRGVNAASATMPGAGIYALMSSIEIELAAPYTLFAYPVPISRTVEEALASIDGLYTTVLEFDPFVPQDQWKVYEPGPGGRKTLTHLRFGFGYWIEMRQNATLYLLGVGPDGSAETTAVMTDSARATLLEERKGDR